MDYRAPNPALELDASLFRDAERARLNYARIVERVPKAVADAIPALLTDVADPDAALNLFERLTEKAEDDLFRQFEEHGELVDYALIVFGNSHYLGETLLQNQDLLPALLRDRNLDRSRSREEFREEFTRLRSHSPEIDMAEVLARFKRREYVRIMLRDLVGVATLSETTAEISALTDVIIEEALSSCQSALQGRYGTPQYFDKQLRLVPTPFSVLALGKLGGNELNYSSDVDLMFLYGDGDEDGRAQISNREYFVRLAQEVTGVLARVTPQGFVFRIDLRLRPQGREGETAISLSQAIRYYVDHAQDWERQALIKVRHSAGDATIARHFIRRLQEHVYTEHVNFVAIETALQARDRIHDRRRSDRDDIIDVKLDRGGIRDIEFLVQCLQRVYGGKERWLRSGGTLFSLQKLHDKEHITSSDFQQLNAAYEFLRKVEHRLQLRHGQQTHRLPSDPAEVAILARSLRDETVTPTNVEAVISERLAGVREIYQRIIHQQQQQTEQQVDEDFALRTLDFSFGRVHSDRQILQRLAADNPVLHAIAAQSNLEPHTRRNLFRFLGSALTSAERYAVIAQDPVLVQKAMDLFRQSDFITDLLIRHPDDIVGLNDLRRSSPRHQAASLFIAGNPVLASHSAALEDYLASNALDQRDRLTLLRRRFRHRMLLSGARDVVESRPVFASLADTTIAAEEAISSALAIAGRPTGLAVLALGRLATYDFDLLSDVDLLFLRAPQLDADAANKCVENMVQALSAYTNEGTVLAVDLRLRPHGAEGELTVTPEQFQTYCANEAQPWEGLTYSKLRFIAGNKEIAAQGLAAVEALHQCLSASDGFASSILDMRSRLEHSSESDNLKTGPGGLYDIDFLVSYLLVKHGIRTAEGNTSDRLRKLSHPGLIHPARLQTLLDALELIRTVQHAARLVTGRTGKWLPVSEIARQSTVELASRILGLPGHSDIESVLRRTMDGVRAIFAELLA